MRRCQPFWGHEPISPALAQCFLLRYGFNSLSVHVNQKWKLYQILRCPLHSGNQVRTHLKTSPLSETGKKRCGFFPPSKLLPQLRSSLQGALLRLSHSNPRHLTCFLSGLESDLLRFASVYRRYPSVHDDRFPYLTVPQCGNDTRVRSVDVATPVDVPAFSVRGLLRHQSVPGYRSRTGGRSSKGNGHHGHWGSAGRRKRSGDHFEVPTENMSDGEGYYDLVARERLGGCFEVVGGAWKDGRTRTYCPFRIAGWFLSESYFLYLYWEVVMGVNVCFKVGTVGGRGSRE